MAGYEKEGEETSSRGVDWEVVSLTASAYAAAPGNEGTSFVGGSKDRDFDGTTVDTLGRCLCLNLPLEPDNNEILNRSQLEDADIIQEEADVIDKDGDKISTGKGLSKNDNLHAIQFSDMSERLSVSGVMPEEDMATLQGYKLDEEGRRMCSHPGCTEGETDEGGSVQFDDGNDIAASDDSSSKSSGFSSKPLNHSKYSGSGIPCESWWKRRAAALYAHAKEAGTLWSLCAAAALMGLVILGQRWHQERWQIHHFNSRSASMRRISRILAPVSRFKYAIAGGGHRRPPAAMSPSL
ncbi:unnamed protein product [Spirodela intermedia]|uniref:Uncharacterized protein n=1 Tax=Spirodela intermedia TaxID=51605 RepID=A0A7I8IZW7_SPIIN|nr:unnamed protein product [Spirodela intermedia]CAA6662600.1 unnamed protein product [Spirodela intermedia]